MSIKKKPSKRGQKAKETKHASPMDLLWQAVRSSAEAMDYSQTSAKQLVDDLFWAVDAFEQVLDELRWVSECLKDQRVQSNAELRTLSLKIWTDAFRLLPYLVAVLTTAGPEIIKRSNENKINKWFGLLMLARLRDDMGAQAEAHRNLQRLGWGIAHNNGWSHPDNNPGWNSPINFALSQQLDWIGKLSRREIYEHMVGNEFRIVSNTIRQRLLDELRAQYRQQRLLYVSDDFLESIPVDQPDPEECLLLRNSLEGLLESDEQLAPYEVSIYTAITQIIQLPDLLCHTDSQVREAIIKGAAAARGISPHQARRDWNKFLAESEKHHQRIVQHMPRRKRPSATRSSKKCSLDEEEAS